MNRAGITCTRVIATSTATVFLSVNEYAHYAERALVKICRESYTHAPVYIAMDCGMGEGRRIEQNGIPSIQV